MFFYLGSWYPKHKFAWTKWKSVQTLTSGKLECFHHLELTKFHSFHALAERNWRKDLLSALGEKPDYRGAEPPPSLRPYKGKKGYGNLLYEAWNGSVDREQSHLSAMDGHFKQRLLKEQKLLKLLETG